MVPPAPTTKDGRRWRPVAHQQRRSALAAPKTVADLRPAAHSGPQTNVALPFRTQKFPTSLLKGTRTRRRPWRPGR